MSVTGIEKRYIKGFSTPQPITSAVQNEQYIEALYNLERRGRLSAAEEKYANYWRF